jgi:hypothetical protein
VQKVAEKINGNLGISYHDEGSRKESMPYAVFFHICMSRS